MIIIKISLHPNDELILLYASVCSLDIIYIHLEKDCREGFRFLSSPTLNIKLTLIFN